MSFSNAMEKEINYFLTISSDTQVCVKAAVKLELEDPDGNPCSGFVRVGFPYEVNVTVIKDNHDLRRDGRVKIYVFDLSNRKLRLFPAKDDDLLTINGIKIKLHGISAPKSYVEMRPKPNIPAFNHDRCAICFVEDMVEPMTTKCGHIFCWVCIHQAVGLKPECPICRKHVTVDSLSKPVKRSKRLAKKERKCYKC